MPAPSWRRTPSPRHRNDIRRDRLHDNTWLVPLLFGVGALVLAIAVSRLTPVSDLVGNVGYRGDLQNAQTVLSTIATAMLTFMAVVFSATLVALQLASGQFSPRVLRTFQRDRRTQVVQGTFLATFVYTLTVLAELGRGGNQAVPFEVLLSLLLVGASLVAFVLYVHHISRSIRAVYVIEAIATETRDAIATAYPAVAAPAPTRPVLDGRPVQVVQSPRGGVVAAVDLDRLADLAERADGFIRVLVPVGAYVATGRPLLEVQATAAAAG